jgi:hypothetical protein
VVRPAHDRGAGYLWGGGPSIDFNILGMSALKAMCSYVTIDYRRSEIVFGFRRRYQPAAPAGVSHQAFEIQEGVPFVSVMHDGQGWPAVVDTGATSKLEIRRSSLDRVALARPPRWIRADQLGLGLETGSAPRRFECLALKSVDCLGRGWQNVDAIIVENESKIGNGLFRDFRFTMDFAGSQIWLEPPGAGEQ